MRELMLKVEYLERSSIYIGKVGESNSTRIKIDAVYWRNKFNNISFEAIYRRADGISYPVNISTDENYIIWDINRKDLYKAGTAYLTLVGYELDKKVISTTAMCFVNPGINGITVDSEYTEDLTPTDWIQSVLDEVGDLKNSIYAEIESAISLAGHATAADLTAHINNNSNPHGVTKTQIGLGNVTNDAQVKGLATGTTSGHIVTWGDNGYTVADSGKTVSDFATAAQGTLAENAMPKAGGTFTGGVSGIAPTDDANLTTKAYVDAQIRVNAASVFKFKGTVANTDKLPTAAADIEGHVYHVTADHGEYVCVKVDKSNAYTWEPLGGVIDLTDYALSADVIQRVENSAGYVPKFNADGALVSTEFTLDTSVPADAVFTDTKVGNVTNSTGKVFTGLANNTTVSTTNVGELVLEGFALSDDSGNVIATDTISIALNKIYNLANSKTSNTGTVTSVAISNGGGLKVADSPITTSGTITITHGDKPTTGTATTNSGRTYIQNITLDTYGHVAGVTTATETVVDTGITSVTANNGLNANVVDRSLTLGIDSISTDLLVNGTNNLIIDCGSAT